MTWGRQVLHVVKKDIREHWVWIVAVIAAVGVALIRMQAWYGGQAGAPSLDLPDFATFLLLATTAIVIVQGDPPGRVTAFWATLPLRKSAVAVAKLCVMGFLVLTVSVGTFAALRLSGAEPPLLEAGLATVATNSLLWLVIVTTIAAMTTDLKGTVLGVVLLFLGVFATGSVMSRVSGFENARIDKYAVVIGLLLTSLLLIPLYRVRQRSLLLRGASALALIVMIMARATDPPRPMVTIAGPVDSTSVTLAHVDRAALSSPDKRKLEVRWQQWARNTMTVDVRDPRVVVVMRDGSRKTLPIPMDQTSFRNDSSAGDSLLLDFTYELALNRDDEAAVLPRLAKDIVRLTVEASIVESMPDEVSRRSIRAGAISAATCRRSRVTVMRPDSSGTILQQAYAGATTNELAEPRKTSVARSRPTNTYALIWPGRTRPIELRHSGGSWRSMYLSFPGLQACGGDSQFSAQRDRDRVLLRADTSWMTNAQLVEYAPKMVRAKRIVASAIVR